MTGLNFFQHGPFFLAEILDVVASWMKYASRDVIGQLRQFSSNPSRFKMVNVDPRDGF